jgi:hypothetical protein
MSIVLYVFGLIFAVLPTAWAAHMLSVQGDPRWLLSIVFCPLAGLLLIAMGMITGKIRKT